MAKRDKKSILVRMPKTLKRRLAREVARRESTLNDVAVELLAADFGVEFTPSGRQHRSPRLGDTGAVLLRVPPELKRQLDAAARERHSSTNKVVVASLTERLDASTPRKEAMPRRNGSQNGKARGNGKVRVAIIGVGNCANSLLQGVEYYKDASPDEFVPGLMHVDLGGYHVRDVVEGALPAGDLACEPPLQRLRHSNENALLISLRHCASSRSAASRVSASAELCANC